jgi:digeranylgeranylglycerophospholipid reductase
MGAEHMRVAIIGAGISGMCCAHELEKHGVRPVIYERNGFIGEAFQHVTAIMNITHRPVKDALEYFRRKYGIVIPPHNALTQVIHNSPNKTTVIEGNLGYMFKNDKECDGVKKQLYSRLTNTEVKLNTMGDYKSLSEEYDYVVISTGRYDFTEELGCWQGWITAYVRGAVVLGEFNPNSLTVWLNRDYCKNGYAYMTAFDRNKAAVVMIVPDVDDKEIDGFWELFVYTEKIKYTIVEEFKLEHRAGFVYPLNIGNIYFTGNSAGGIDPFLGFGIFNSVVTGVSAARSILTGENYEKQLKYIMKRNIHMRQFRRVFDKMTNKDCDNLIASIGLPGIKQALYSSRLNISSIGAFASKFILKGEGKK